MNATTRQHRVIVTDHALQRWLERGAEYGDDTREDVIAAFRSAVEVPYTMIPRVSAYIGKMGTSDRYYRLDRPGLPTVWFVADRSGEGTTIITVLHDTRSMAPTPVSEPTPEPEPDTNQLIKEKIQVIISLSEELRFLTRDEQGKVRSKISSQTKELNKLQKKLIREETERQLKKKKQNSG